MKKRILTMTFLGILALNGCGGGGSAESQTANPINNVPAVAPANYPPVANAGADQSVIVGSVVALNAARSKDLEGASLKYRWTLQQKPDKSGFTISDPTAQVIRFSPDVIGKFTFSLIVNDGNQDSAPSGVSVLVNAGVLASGSSGVSFPPSFPN